MDLRFLNVNLLELHKIIYLISSNIQENLLLKSDPQGHNVGSGEVMLCISLIFTLCCFR